NNGVFRITSPASDSFDVVGAGLVAESANSNVIITELVAVTDTDGLTAAFSNTSGTISTASAWNHVPTAGEWIHVRGADNSSNDGDYFVTAVSGQTLSVYPAPAVDEVEGD